MTTQTEVEHAFGMFLDQIRGETGVEKMFEQISVFAQIFDCDSIAYGARTHVQNVQGKSASMLPKISTHPEEWQEHCLKNGYDILDPSAKPGVLQWSPLPWDDAYKTQIPPTENGVSSTRLKNLAWTPVLPFRCRGRGKFPRP